MTAFRSFLMLFFFAPAMALAEDPEPYSGTLGKTPVYLRDVLSGTDCSHLTVGGAAEVEKSGPTSGLIIIYKDFDRTKVSQKIQASRHVENFNGVKSEVYEALSFTYKNKPTALVLRRSLEKNFLTWAQDDGICPDSGWVPGQIRLIFNPQKKQDVLNWLRLHDSLATKYGPLPRPQNFLVLDVPVGLEDELISNLRKQTWVIEARREPEEAGSGNGMVDLHANTLFTPQITQSEMQAKLLASLKSAFPELSIRNDDIAPIRGFSYRLSILTPTIKLNFHDQRFLGYWLKTDVEFYISRQLDTGDKPFERIEIAVEDGSLPRWPENEQNPPPEGQINQARLAPNHQSATKNYEILLKLMERIGTKFATDYNGSFEAPG